MKILMLALKDMKHPDKGGAEVVTDIYLKELVKQGHEVILFSSKFKGALDKDKINGYNIIRKGNKLAVSPLGLLYACKNQDQFDIIIDQINTIPFLTPLLIKKEKRIAFFHQLCKNVWFWEMPLSSPIGYAIESLYLKFYKNTKCLVVSDSTKKDLIKYAWVKPENILVLENQIDFNPIKTPTKKENQFVYVGRLTPSKRIHDCIKAMSLVDNKKTKLIIIGSGNEKYKRRLEHLTKKLNLTNRVIFTGNINNKERNKLMQQSLAILVTSVREGWGLIVTEANANGTLAITYNVPGLVDANKTGIITKNNTSKELAICMSNLINNPKIRKEKEAKALKFAREHNDWSKNINKLNSWLIGGNKHG